VNTHSAITTILKAALLTGVAFGVSMPAASQTAEENYANLLQQIENKRLTIAQREAYIATQEAEMESLKQQIKDSKGTIATIEPMFQKMVAAIDGEINKDIPFLKGVRFQRLDKLKADINDPTRRPGEKLGRKPCRTFQYQSTSC